MSTDTYAGIPVRRGLFRCDDWRRTAEDLMAFQDAVQDALDTEDAAQVLAAIRRLREQAGRPGRGPGADVELDELGPAEWAFTTLLRLAQFGLHDSQRDQLRELAKAARVRFREDAAADADAMAAEVIEESRHLALLRQHMAAHGLEDPTWVGLSERQKQALRDADAAVLAAVERQEAQR